MTKKHNAPVATSQEILNAVGVTIEECEQARKLLSDKIKIVGQVPVKKKKRVQKLVKDLEKVVLTPERIQQIIEETRERRKREEEEAKKPPKTPVGTCGVCKGAVKAEYVHGLHPGYDHRSIPIGPGSKNYYGWNFKGYHCENCGLMYKFAPNPHQD